MATTNYDYFHNWLQMPRIARTHSKIDYNNCHWGADSSSGTHRLWNNEHGTVHSYKMPIASVHLSPVTGRNHLYISREGSTPTTNRHRSDLIRALRSVNSIYAAEAIRINDVPLRPLLHFWVDIVPKSNVPATLQKQHEMNLDVFQRGIRQYIKEATRPRLRIASRARLWNKAVEEWEQMVTYAQAHGFPDYAEIPPPILLEHIDPVHVGKAVLEGITFEQPDDDRVEFIKNSSKVVS